MMLSLYIYIYIYISQSYGACENKHINRTTTKYENPNIMFSGRWLRQDTTFYWHFRNFSINIFKKSFPLYEVIQCIVIYPLQQWLRERSTMLRYTGIFYLLTLKQSINVCLQILGGYRQAYLLLT